MSNGKLGRKIREQRDAMGLSQANLAKRIGVRPSHVAYIESNQRRPSLSLLRRIAQVLSLDAHGLFVLSHPDAKYFLPDTERKPSAKGKDAWHQFLTNRALLRRHKVTASEVKMLRQVSLLSDVSTARDFFFILNTIRQAAEPEP
jgi:transcriptional regulator with XRE-family HTH domain